MPLMSHIALLQVVEAIEAGPGDGVLVEFGMAVSHCHRHGAHTHNGAGPSMR